MDTFRRFIQVGRHQKKYQKMVEILLVTTSRKNKYFLDKTVTQKLCLPCPLENETRNGHKLVNFKVLLLDLNS